jgi:hypothetical protein
MLDVLTAPGTRITVHKSLKILIFVAMFFSQYAQGSAFGVQQVDNFVLLDQRGESHELYYHSDARAVVIMVHGNGCGILRATWPAFSAIRDRYAGQGVHFLMLNSNLQDDRVSIAAEASEFGFDLPILDDRTQLIGESLGLTRTAEVIVIDPQNWQIVYRGPVDDRVTYERQKTEATENYLADALDYLIDPEAPGRAIEVATRMSPGCIVNLTAQNADHSTISYSETIAPLLQENCVSCHQEGGLGPWAMNSYTMVHGFAPMIREVVRTQRMPPWHADPHVGTWEGDRSLSDEEVKQLVHWVEAGAPRGDGPDPLAEKVAVAPDWPLGQPDLIIDVPAFEVAATGTIEYQYPVVSNPLNHGVWVKAVTVAPGDRRVVHHVLAGATNPDKPEEQQDLFDNYLIGYAPGNESQMMPPGTGVYIPPGGDFLLQMHYTPFGKKVTDATRLGLYFHEEPPGNFLRHHVILDPTIRIPAHEKRYTKSGYFDFEREATLFTLLPHAHFRGRSASFTLRYPDGTEQLLLSVPKYDFNWQRSYAFSEPKIIPAGSRLIYTSVFDNSAQNPGNPDPGRVVPWGLQSWDEMLYGDILFSWNEETAVEPIHDHGRMQIAQMFGFMDANQDAIFQWEEMSEKMRQSLEPRFSELDRNGDGGLSIDEYLQLLSQPGQSGGR